MRQLDLGAATAKRRRRVVTKRARSSWASGARVTAQKLVGSRARRDHAALFSVIKPYVKK
jgi:hypothetical protein